MWERLKQQMVKALETYLEGGELKVPEAGLQIWRWFLELAAARSYHAGGPNPISFAEIEAWARLKRWPLEPRHVEAIRALDAAWLAHIHRQFEKQRPTKPAKSFSPGAFDAVFG